MEVRGVSSAIFENIGKNLIQMSRNFKKIVTKSTVSAVPADGIAPVSARYNPFSTVTWLNFNPRMDK